MTKKNDFITSKLKRLQKPFELSVYGNSMAPLLNNGDKILVEPCIHNKLKPGDIIVYQKFSDHLTVHRIVDITALSKTRFYCETKGDNNSHPDTYKVFSHEIIGIINMKGRKVK